MSAASVDVLRVTALANGGSGVVRRSGEPTVFCPGALPGELVEARIVRRRPRFHEAALDAVIEASPARRSPPCPIVASCGGCTLQHADADWARAALVDAARHDIGRALGAAAVGRIGDALAGPADLRYRCRIRVHLNPAGDFGFYPAGGGALVPIGDCLLAPDGLAASLTAVPVDLRRQLAGDGWSEVELRQGADGRRDLDAQPARGARHDTAGPAAARQLAARLAAAGKWAGVRVGDVEIGEPAIRYEVAGVTLTAGPGAFVQANPAANAVLVGAVLALAGDVRGLRVFDLYGGIGNLGLPLARAGADVDIVEAAPTAARWARFNIRACGLTDRARLHEGPVDRMLAGRATGSADLIVLDPPRAGAAEAIAELRRLAPASIIYVSCHLHTMLRDLGRLGERWQVTAIVPVDMFPQTGHLEWVVALTRKDD